MINNRCKELYNTPSLKLCNRNAIVMNLRNQMRMYYLSIERGLVDHIQAITEEDIIKTIMKISFSVSLSSGLKQNKVQTVFSTNRL
jgi:hypothetical protein